MTPQVGPNWWLAVWQTWWSRTTGATSARSTDASRLTELIRYARANSPFYREAYRDLPDGIADLAALPVVNKRILMERFEDWLTDRSIRRVDIDAFLADRSHIGDRFRGRYAIWKSSGTTGEPGIYVHDAAALAVYDALIAVQLASLPLASRCVEGLLFHGGRAALVAAIGDHFASIASWQRVCRSAPGLAARGFSIMDPIDKIVADLNAFAPAFLASYPTMLTLLAQERQAGRLKASPALIWSGGEFLAPAAKAYIERCFGCPVLNEYGASECMSIAFGCPAGWLHVNSDWVIVEAVDAEFRPVPAGTTSHTVLITNLANRVQPILRYDLGDSVSMKPGRCECGNPLPAMQVQGRREQTLSFTRHDGHIVELIPLALTTVVEDAVDLHRYQIVRRGPDHLALRFDTDDAPRKQAVFERAAGALRDFLARQGIGSVRITLDPIAPVRDRSGKLREVLAEEQSD